MFANIVSVYETLKDLVNKDQRGFVTPITFNRFAGQAQLNIYNALFNEYEQYRRSGRQSIGGKRDKSRLKQLEEDLAFFSKKATIQKTNNIFSKPDDLSRIIGVTTFGSVLLGQSTKTVIDVCYDEEKIERILLSDISSPSESAPVALVSNAIEVFPSQITRIIVRYYKIPESTTPSGVRSPSKPSVDTESPTPANCFNFELPAHYEYELVIEIAKMLGLNLRDTDVVNFSLKEEQPKLNK
jgi:hypothetical protein